MSDLVSVGLPDGEVPTPGIHSNGRLFATPVLEVEDLAMHFRTGGALFGAHAIVRAVDGVSFTIPRGQTLGLVGESGSGKSTVGRCVLRLIDPTAGKIVFEGRDIAQLDRRRLRPIRRAMHTVFQDPYSSLNPRHTIATIVAGPLRHHGVASGARARSMALDLLERVGLRRELGDRYPHGLSGGQRQRVAIARALVVKPALIVADEPISALDASVQAAVMNLLLDLQRELQFSCLFITHDLSAAAFMSDRIAVMYAGQILEMADRAPLFQTPRHPYTQALLSAVLVPDPREQRKRSRVVLGGDPPSPVAPPPGCRFHPRCPLAVDQCRRDVPRLLDHAGNGHWAACHLIGPHGEPPDVLAVAGRNKEKD